MVNTDGCAGQYRCASALYLMSVLSQLSSIAIYWSISALGYEIEVINGVNAIAKRCIYQLMSNVQLSGLKKFDSQIIMHSCTPKNDVILDK